MNEITRFENLCCLIHSVSPHIEFREYEHDNKTYDVDLKKIQLLTAMDYPLALDKVEIKQSRIHGNGAFAKVNINKDELITFYPADIVRYMPNKRILKEDFIGIVYYSNRFANKIKNDPKIIVEHNSDYIYDLDDHHTIIGDPDFKDPSHVGHLINDAAKHNSTERSITVYVTVSLLRSNCVFYHCKGNLHVAVIAKRNIKEGEELFVHYGIPYWISANEKYSNKDIKNE
jgi:hypothetical protein